MTAPTWYAQFRDAIGDRYDILDDLGSGATAVVFDGYDRRHRRRVAVKVLRPELSASVGATRFLREIETLAPLQHPHIMPLLDSGTAGGLLYFVMPIVEGETLRTRLRRERKLSVNDTLRILLDVSDAVAAAHRQGVVHRDLKPENVILTGRHAVVMDFGIAKALAASADQAEGLTEGLAIGTPAYMSPEQALATPDVDQRADVYAIGILGYEMLAGAPPFAGHPADILSAHVAMPPEPLRNHCPELPPQLEQIITRCLAKSPADRWSDGDALAQALEPLAAPSGVTTPARPLPRAKPAPRWLPWTAATITVAAVTFGVWRRRGEPPGHPEQHQLTFGGEASMAAIAPDGELLAYVQRQGGEQELWVRDTKSSSSPIKLARGQMVMTPSWSPDGAEVRYQFWDGGRDVGLRASPRLGGTVRRLANGFFTQMSPDGTRLARVFETQDTVHLIDLTKADTSRVPLTDPFDENTSYEWSPGSDRIILARRSLGLNRWGLVVVDVASKRETVVLEDTVAIGVPIWAPRGEGVYFLRDTGPFKTLLKVEIRPDGTSVGPARVLASGIELSSMFPGQLSVTRDGRRLTYVRHQSWSNLGVLDVRTGATEPASLTTGTAMHSTARYSPNDSLIAFIRSEPTGVSINLMNVATGVSELVDRLPIGYDLAWAPDGRRLAVITTGTNRELGVMVYSRTGTTSRFMPGKVGQYLSWAPGPFIVLQVSAAALGTIDPETGTSTWAFGHDGTKLFPRISPKGRLAFYWTHARRAESGLWTVTPPDSAARRLTNALVYPLRWPSEETVFVTEFGHIGDPPVQRVMSVSVLNPGAPTLVATIPNPFTAEDITRDGRRILTNRLEERSDVWVIDRPDPAYR